MNKKIIVAAVVITGSGVVNAWSNSKPITPVILGGYIFILVLAVMDMFGGPLADLSGALAMLAALYVLLTEFPWSKIIGLVKPETATPAGTKTGK